MVTTSAARKLAREHAERIAKAAAVRLKAKEEQVAILQEELEHADTRDVKNAENRVAQALQHSPSRTPHPSGSLGGLYGPSQCNQHV